MSRAFERFQNGGRKGPAPISKFCSLKTYPITSGMIPNLGIGLFLPYSWVLQLGLYGSNYANSFCTK